ncbi:sensor histidine kinase [Piscinibacter gummiphilus]|uniref:histidine kinase n=1 Tax=Piscinibacter gummiphilus TaxID=946333 RepID=A0A1W6L602_9BURK|nr:HAMP domain-containing sensor histidine kinase [Piscinibacter gummiphilus]ARN19610.1 two-component sensor histidine kinase [Piscinibacter gummiphilus]ATU64279.1 sensor histidine kinase [Piscinibacter gummiphilus]GLS93478.1 two-component sensor histidine kinase [Piscinibacter gummiphilus]
MKIQSLRWRLVRDLVVLQVAVSLLVLCGLLILSWSLDKLRDESGDRSAAILVAALGHGPDGLSLEPTEDVRWLQSEATDLWFVARDDRGGELKHGHVPPRYLSLIDSTSGFGAASLDFPVVEDGRQAVRLRRWQTADGAINLVVSTGAPLRVHDVFRGTLLAFLILIAPMALFTSLAFVVAVPWVVKRGLRGLQLMGKRAERISMTQRSERLPLDSAPSEVRPLVEAVNRAFDRLNQGYLQQERFLADAAHELRTPIATLQVNIEALPEGPGRAALLRSVIRLGTLAEQLLDLQRLVRPTASRESFDLKPLCERVAADLAPLAIQSDCNLSVEARPLIVTGDETSIERALSNLIQNAIEHGGPGCDINVALVHPACIEVSDSGPGIPEAERDRVVEPFHRLKPRSRGAGLGLHLVAEVARLHGGRMTVGRSSAGGALIRLFLSDQGETPAVDASAG